VGRVGCTNAISLQIEEIAEADRVCAPHGLFAIVDDVLPSLDRVTVLGCSLGDRHVTDRLLRWLEGNPRGRLTIVGPDQHEVGPRFAPVAGQVRAVALTTREYLEALEKD
jgi:hypothetical protein